MTSLEILQVGRPAPFFRVRNSHGQAVSFTDIRKNNRHVVLCFCRGHWCPACVARLEEINAHVRELEDLGAAVYAVSVDSPDQSEAMREEMGLKFDILSDQKRSMVRAWDLYNPHEAGGIAKPATVVLDKDGVVRYLAREGMVKHAPISRVVEFLDQCLLEGEHQAMDQPTTLARVALSTARQTGRNLLHRGSRDNWKHYVTLSVELGLLLHNALYGGQRVFLSREYAVPPETVFPYLATPELMSLFLDATLTRIQDSPSDKDNPNGIGSVRKVKIGPTTLEETITRLEPPYLCQYVISQGSPLKDYTGTILVSKTQDGCRVVWTMSFKAKIPYTGRFIAKAMELGFAKGLKALDKFVQ
ncbi:MAG: redoxin domain-containing protein [Desulfatibacillum sp.]|nr:redoxin domain-containing protein [Desulfatibacillum sp.]